MPVSNNGRAVTPEGTLNEAGDPFTLSLTTVDSGDATQVYQRHTTTDTYGGQGSLFGKAFTPEDVNDPNFGVVVSAKGTGVFAVNTVQVRVHYASSHTPEAEPEHRPLDHSSVVVTRTGRMVIVQSGGGILHSDDGTTWTPVTSPTQNTLYKVIDTPQGLFAVGKNGTLITSTDDAETWQRLTLPVTNTVLDIFYDRGRRNLLAVCTNGVVMARRRSASDFTARYPS